MGRGQSAECVHVLVQGRHTVECRRSGAQLDSTFIQADRATQPRARPFSRSFFSLRETRSDAAQRLYPPPPTMPQLGARVHERGRRAFACK
jgi:hypothetical protein